MEILRPTRLRNTVTYFRMNEFQKKCFNLGLPQRYISDNVKNLKFRDYCLDTDIPKQISSSRQRNWLIDTTEKITRNSNINMIVGSYSDPTDDAAFLAAGFIFCTALKHGMSCRCVSATRIAENFNKIPVSDLYIIHGITSEKNPSTTWAVRDFLRERDGSFRIIVMTADKNQGPWEIIRGILRMKINILLCLEDTTTEIIL